MTSPFYVLLLALLVSLVASLTLDELPRRLDHSRVRDLEEDLFDDRRGSLSSINLGSPLRQTSKRKAKDDEYFPESRYFIKDDGDDDLENDNDIAWSPPLHSFRSQVKRNTRSGSETGTDKDTRELESILKDDDNVGSKSRLHRERKIPPDVKRRPQESRGKQKRQSPGSPPDLGKEGSSSSSKLEERDESSSDSHNPDFEEWLRREYYRNMAKSFASMRRKRADKTEGIRRSRRDHRAVDKKNSVRFEDVVENLKAMESALLWDAARAMENEDENDPRNRIRIDDDLSAAYDMETIRAALFRLQDTLQHRDRAIPNSIPRSDEQNLAIFKDYRKRGEQCPPLDVLTSDCSILGDIVSDDSVKDLLTHACNWHEVCYSCGEVFGLSSENCDMGFVEQSRTICRGDVPCQSTASLLLLPLRQRRVFYKRSNPSVCLVDPCVEAFLTEV